MDTIFALASGRGKAGVAVVRLSGPAVEDVCISLFGRDLPARKASLRKITDASGLVVDHALVLRFANAASFTGEDVLELHLHGSVAITSKVLALLAEQLGCRMAEPGEFTRRALHNGMMDLTEVEGLADLIDAETEAQRRQAMRVFSGELGGLCEDWRVKLIRAAALLQATIDFADEDVPEDVFPEVKDLLGQVLADLNRQVSGVEISERIRDGFEVAIVGPPNIGKSTLLNRLAGREAAITSEIAGTTRDVVEVRMDLRGLPVTFLDTAGIRDSQDHVEKIGIDRAITRAQAADLRLVLVEDLSDEALVEIKPGDLVRCGKSDLSGDAQGVSGLSGGGTDQMLNEIFEVLSKRAASASIATNRRHLDAMAAAKDALESAQKLLEQEIDHSEIVAEHIRQALYMLEALIGRVDVENVLDEVFASFCLGK